MRCNKHPWYTGKRKPRTGCETCWEIYRLNHPDTQPKQDTPVAEPTPQN